MGKVHLNVRSDVGEQVKLIHELYTRVQVGGGSVRPYAQRVGEKKLPVSGYVDELILVSPAAGLNDEEVVRIEGDLRVVVDALEEALGLIEELASLEVDEGRLDPKWKDHPPCEYKPKVKKAKRRSKR